MFLVRDWFFFGLKKRFFDSVLAYLFMDTFCITT